MKFSFDVGETEKCRAEFSRNPFNGRVTVTVDGESVTLTSPWDPSTHFETRLTRRYQFTVGDEEKHEVVIEKERPLLCAGLRRQKYRVLVDDSLVEEHYGF